MLRRAIPLSAIDWPDSLAWIPSHRNHRITLPAIGIWRSDQDGYWSGIAPAGDHYQLIQSDKPADPIAGFDANILFRPRFHNSRSLNEFFRDAHFFDHDRARAILQLDSCGLAFFENPDRIAITFPERQAGHERFHYLESIQDLLHGYGVPTRLT